MEYDYSKLLGLMREKGVTQEMLAPIAGCSAPTMNMKLNNKSEFTQKQMNAICDYFGITDVKSYFFARKLKEA